MPFYIFCLVIGFNIQVNASLCDKLRFIECPGGLAGSRSSSGGSFPSNTSSMNINPAAVSVERGFGAEVIEFDGEYDVSLVTGTGAIGSGLSSTNNEGTFFGNVGNETIEHFEDRKVKERKFDSDKVSLAVAIQLNGKRRKRKRQKKRWSWVPMFYAGLIGKYNQSTENFNGGGGLSMQMGPFTASASRYTDDYFDFDVEHSIKYHVTTRSVGIKIFNLVAEYTTMENDTPEASRVRLFSSTAFFKKVLFTYAFRTEFSKYPKYDFETKNFTDQWEKSVIFWGTQLAINKKFLLGAYYNYYMNRDVSFGVTVFF